MLIFLLTLWFLSGFSFVLGFFPLEWEIRPRLMAFGQERAPAKQKKSFSIFKTIALINKPICGGTIRLRISRDIAMAHVNLSPEEFFLLKEIVIAFILIFTYPMIQSDMILFWVFMSVGCGYMMPEYWLKGKIKNVKSILLKELPDAVDLLGLCVNAGLDFMLALRWVIEKSAPSIMINELNTLLQEINVGKTRRDALKSLADKYKLPDMSTFSRTLIQADKMGTSVSEALTMLAEDMREARYRRGEQLAMKAPMKLLVPLLFFIFPVVGVLVAGPIFLQFMLNSPMQKLTGSG